MEYEKLALEVGAVRAGLTPVKSRVVPGDSGVEHRFDMLFTDGTRLYGFDFYERVTEVEMVRSYIKKFDTGTAVKVVCLSGEVTPGARALAVAYDMKVLSPKDAEAHFVVDQSLLKAC